LTALSPIVPASLSLTRVRLIYLIDHSPFPLNVYCTFLIYLIQNENFVFVLIPLLFLFLHLNKRHHSSNGSVLKLKNYSWFLSFPHTQPIKSCRFWVKRLSQIRTLPITSTTAILFQIILIAHLDYYSNLSTWLCVSTLALLHSVIYPETRMIF
jgi:hypothetical protein